MTQSTEPLVTAAIERGDAGWLTAHVDGTACPAALLTRLARHDDPRLRLLAVRWLGDRLAATPDTGDDVARLLATDPARLLPGGLDGGPDGGLDATPEVALATAELFERHGHHLPTSAWPHWRAAAPPSAPPAALPGALPAAAPGGASGVVRSVAPAGASGAASDAVPIAVPAGASGGASDAVPIAVPAGASDAVPAVVRVAWARAEVLHLPGRLAAEPAGEVLYQAVAGLRAAGAPDPRRLVDELAGRGDPVLDAAALRLCREALHAAVLAPGAARGVLVRLLDSADPGVVAGALSDLAQPWAAVAGSVTDRVHAMLTAGEAAVDVLEAAIAAAARHGLRDPLLAAAADPAVPPRARRRALEALGDLLDRASIPAVVELAATDPLLLGPPAVACLVAMHHRGLFAAGDAAAGIAGLALADHTIPAEDVAMLLYTARHRLRDALLDAGPADPGWPRRLELLVALARQGAPDLDLGADVARLLPVAVAPEPFLGAIRALRFASAEDAVLAALPRSPAAALHALEAVGGARTVAVLTGALEGDVAAYLRPWRHQALELCWRLVDDPARRHALLRRLDPAALPEPIAADLGRPDERELAVLRARSAPDRPVEALVRLARDADTRTVPAVTEVLGRIVAELAVAWDTRGLPPGQRHTVPADVLADAGTGHHPAGGGQSAGGTASMPVVPQRAVDAVHGLGRRLYTRGRIRPVCLLDATSERAAGDALVAGVALALLDRPRTTPTELAILLELLQRAPHEGTRAHVHRLLRHRDPHVRKHVIALLARDGGGAEALSATLTVLTGAADVQTVRQALVALGQVGARWAGHAVAACLEHPNMNVKKAAAEALRTAGTPATVPQLLAWLGRHDNPGLRTALTSALRAVLDGTPGPDGTAARSGAFGATILAAAEQADAGRTRDLLLESLDGALPALAVAALADQGSPAAPALLRLVATGRVRLRSGTVASLAGRMAAHGITAPPATPTAEPNPDVVALTRDGWHDRTARRVAADPGDLPEALLPALRALLPDWLRLAAADPALRPQVVRLILRCCPAPWTDAERAAFARRWQPLVAAVGELPPAVRDALLALLEDLAPHLTPADGFDVSSAIRRVRPAPAGRRTTLTLLRRCGAVLTRADVERSLADAALGADPWEGEVRVLREAFAVPAPDVPASGSRARLAELVAAWPGAAAGDRPGLLDRMAALQPIDAPLWTIGEVAGEPGAPPRVPRDGDLDQPRSAVQTWPLVGSQ